MYVAAVDPYYNSPSAFLPEHTRTRAPEECALVVPTPPDEHKILHPCARHMPGHDPSSSSSSSSESSDVVIPWHTVQDRAVGYCRAGVSIIGPL